MSEHAQIDTRRSSGPRILLYSSCVAILIRDYLLSKPAIAERFCVDILLMANLEQDGISDLADTRYRTMIESADVIGANVYTPKWKHLGLHRIHELKRQTTPLITWAPPNCACFWPVVEGYGEEGVVRMLQDGACEQDIFEAYDSDRFDPQFHFRFANQIGRLREIESECQVKISYFAERNHLRSKLWFTPNHVTYNTAAWMGSEFARAIGIDLDSEEACLSYPLDMRGTWNVFPETHYEFDHYGFMYPMRYRQTDHWGGREWYKTIISKICTRLAIR